MGAPLGNKNGVRQNRLVTDTLRKVVTQNPNKIRKACETLLDEAEEGNIPALREIFDRLDGKPAQTIDATLANPDGSNLEPSSNIEIARKIAYVLDAAVKDKQSDDPALH